MDVISREHVKQAMAVLVVVLTVTATVGAAEYRASLDVGSEEGVGSDAADCTDAAGTTASDDGGEGGETTQTAEACPDTVATTGAS